MSINRSHFIYSLITSLVLGIAFSRIAIICLFSCLEILGFSFGQTEFWISYPPTVITFSVIIMHFFKHHWLGKKDQNG